MSAVPWSTLAAPFPASSLRWHAVGRSADGLRVRLAPHLAPEALRERLDTAVGPDGWSFELRAWTASSLIADLTVRGVSRAAVAQVLDRPGIGADDTVVAASETVTGAALTAAAALFGATLPTRGADDDWVDADPESGAALHPPQLSMSAPASEPIGVPASEPAAGAPASEDGKPEPHRVIDRLVERLREEGLGGEAAKLVSRYGGYGADVAQSRELYAKLRSLLLERSGAG